MKTICSAFLMLAFISGYSQKIIMKKDLHRSRIKQNEYVGINLKNEEFHFKEWKNICRDCMDTTVSDFIWKIDSIKNNYIIVSQLYPQDSCYKFDTVDHMTYIRKEKYYQDWIVQEWFSSPDQDFLKTKYILKYPIIKNIRRIPLDSIESFTFPKNKYCRNITIVTPLTALLFITMAPFMAKGEERFHWDLFLFTETIGLSKGFGFLKYIENNKVKTYPLNAWKLKIKN